MNDGIRILLEKERSVHLAEIHALYKTLDRKFQMRAAEVPVELGYSEERLGSYTRRSHDEEEHFFFSLLFLGYCLKNPLSKDERIDLYKHEYAHYLQYHMEIPKKYMWEPGIHGSAWKYCCMLVGCVPTPYYKAGEKLLHKQDYDKILKNPIHDKTVPLRDQLRTLAFIEYGSWAPQAVKYMMKLWIKLFVNGDTSKRNDVMLKLC